MNDSGLSPAATAMRRALGSEAFLNGLPIGIYCCDRDGFIRQFNRRAAELWGREPAIGETEERFCGAHKLYRSDGTPLPHDETPMADVLRIAVPARDQHVLVERPDGTRRHVLVNIEPLFDPDGAFVGAVNCFQDISELERVHHALQDNKDELEDFFENAGIGLHIVDADGVIARANRAELDMLGYTSEEYVGRAISEFHVDGPVIEDILSRLFRGEALDRYPARLRAKDGSIRHVHITSSARFRDGKFVGTRCSTLDVTRTMEAEERALEGEQRFRDVLETFPMAVYTTDAEGTITYCNPAAVALAGREPEIGVDKWCVTWRLFKPDGTPLPHEECPMAVTLRERRAVKGAELIAMQPNGTRVRCVPYPTLLYSRDGKMTGAVNVLVDITDRYRAELESAHLAAIVSSSSDAIVSKTLEGIVQTWNEGARRIFGYDPEEMIGEPITRIIPPELHSQEDDILARLRRGERLEHFETERVAKDGRRINVSLTVSPVHDRFGRIVGASKVARDITERKRAEELQRLLISELNHRVKNTLATVQSIANQTVRLARDPAAFAASFSGRIQALAHTHDLLTRNSWQGADVLSLLRDQLLIGGAEDERITFSGPAITLDPQPALHLALVLHELGTNARKYGSLSVPTGRLSVRWSVETNGDRRFLLRWKESGGPPVKVPTTRGFGTTLIAKSLAAHDGEVSLSYRAEGLLCEIVLPVSERTDESGAFWTPRQLETPVPAVPAQSKPSRARGARVLIVEDEAPIALEVAATLEEAGCKVVGPAATLEKAREHIAAGGFDVAFLDANLDGNPVDELAAALTRADIPFAFLTGYGRDELPEAFRQALMITKPLTGDAALDVLARLAGRNASAVPIRKKRV
ncbi:PAS domain S-box protein [Chelativorans sp. M5D2P16]|uniref:PAS domain S-box protein n=1 Tax=Chelativorans sp. M5D2P16 TaxID=3095678 RepID=UPI002ACA005E|nr:PAS domain S-box protein [Chelativorans sp. M5D2P16]MDZ5696055.1 PAS domain S-box protein [Chelativorans sp. M5D2P16]